MKSTKLLVLMGVVLAGQLVASPLPDDWDSIVERGMAEWKLPGAAIAIVKDGEPILVKGYGVREFGKTDPVDAETLFAIGSTTKAFSSAAIATLVDAGKVAWDTHIHEVDPGLAFSDPWITKEIRVSDCFANHSGLSVISESLWYGTGFSRDEILKRLAEVPFDEGFRYRFQYRNVMFLVGGELIPRLTGTSWDDYLGESLFAPLEMTRTYPTEKGIEAMENVAEPHLIDYQGRPLAVPYRNMHNIAPAGSIISCARDLVHWLQFHLGDGSFQDKPLLKPESLAFLHSGQTPISTIGPAGQPLSPPAELRSYALGWVTESYRGTRLVWHNGGIDGMSTWVGLAPELGLGFAIVSNLEECNLRNALFYRLVDHVAGREPLDLNPELVKTHRAALAARDAAEVEWQKLAELNAAPPLPLDAYAGTYHAPAFGPMQIRVDDGLLVYERTQEMVLDLVWKDDRTFIGRYQNAAYDLRDGKSDLIFDVQDGKVTGVTEGGILVFTKNEP